MHTNNSNSELIPRRRSDISARRIKQTTALLMMVLYLSRLGFSQSPDSGSIRGQILDQNGAAIVGAEVSALNQQTVFHRETKTDKGGLLHSCFSLQSVYSLKNYGN